MSDPKLLHIICELEQLANAVLITLDGIAANQLRDLTEAEKLAHDEKYGKDAMVIGPYIITKRK